MTQPSRNFPCLAAASTLALAVALTASAVYAETPLSAETPSAADAPPVNPEPVARDADGASANTDFDPIFFQRGSAPAADVSRYARGNPIPAGRYLVDLRVNGDVVARAEVQFVAGANADSAEPCLDEATLGKFGVDLTKIAPEGSKCRGSMRKNQPSGRAGISRSTRRRCTTW